MELTFVMFKEDGKRRDFQLKKQVTIIGRGNDCDLQIPLLNISRKHCQIKVQGNTVMVEDLGSSNGTYHNNQRVDEPESLDPGDYVRIGPVTFTVVIDGEPKQIKPIRSIPGEAAVAAAASSKHGESGEIPVAEPFSDSGEIPMAEPVEIMENEVPVAQPVADTPDEISIAEPVEEVGDSELDEGTKHTG
ncbi:MAG TPA: FHA domain-containing protein [Phycisphaerae bacterium]|nr:FHA domain-containing protein [Phycisphaerae bacterium]